MKKPAASLKSPVKTRLTPEQYARLPHAGKTLFLRGTPIKDVQMCRSSQSSSGSSVSVESDLEWEAVEPVTGVSAMHASSQPVREVDPSTEVSHSNGTAPKVSEAQAAAHEIPNLWQRWSKLGAE